MQRLLQSLLVLFLLPTPALAETTEVIVLVEAEAKPDNIASVLMGFKNSQGQCPQWEGCLDFQLTVSDNNPNLVILVERWTSAALHRKEVQSIMGQDSFAEFRALLVKDLNFHYLNLQ